MKKVKDLLVVFIIIVYLFITFFPIKSILEWTLTLHASFLLVISFICYLLFGLKKDKSNNLKRKEIGAVVTYILVYYIIMYISGIFFGYKKFSFSYPSFFGFCLYFISIVLLELTRYILIHKSKEDKYFIVMYTFLIALLKYLPFFEYNNQLLMLIVFIDNILLSYLSYHLGFKVVLIYSILSEVMFYILPIVPKINTFFLIILFALSRISIYFYLKRDIAFYNKVPLKLSVTKKTQILVAIPFIFLFISISVLISKCNPYYMIGVGSNSMNPTISVGDALIVHKLDKNDTLKKGDIVVYEYNGKMIAHRIIEVRVKNSKSLYITKGDNNFQNDSLKLEQDDIEGIVILKIPYISYPAVIKDIIINKLK